MGAVRMDKNEKGIAREFVDKFRVSAREDLYSSRWHIRMAIRSVNELGGDSTQLTRDKDALEVAMKKMGLDPALYDEGCYKVEMATRQSKAGAIKVDCCKARAGYAIPQNKPSSPCRHRWGNEAKPKVDFLGWFIREMIRREKN